MRAATPSVDASSDLIAGTAPKNVFVTVAMIEDEDCDFMTLNSVADGRGGLLIF